MEKKYDVFISYSSHDQKIAEGICGFLESNGYRCFVAYRDIPRGVVWAAVIPDAIKNSAIMVVVFSNSFNISPQTDREIGLASDKIPILTYRIADDKMTGAKEFYLMNLNWIDAFPNPEDYFGKLLESVKKLVPKDKIINVEIDWPDNVSESDEYRSPNTQTTVSESLDFSKAKDDELPIWKDSINKGNWQIIRKDADGFRLERKEKQGAIEIGFWEDHYYIQAEYGGFVDFAKTMKRKYGGRRSYGTWWRHINETGIYELKQGEFLEKFNQNESIQKTVSNWIDILISEIDSFTPFANWWNTLNENGIIEKYAQNWCFWIWAEESTYCFERFVCDYVNEEYGNPFIDAFCTDDKIVFVLYNREDNEEKLEKLVKDHKIESLKTIKEDYQVRHVVKELPLCSSEKEIAKCLENLIELIDSPAMA